MAIVMYFVSGVLFALGLGIAGMTQPQKITDFLNILGDWDPSLLMVMLGAAGTYMFAYRFIVKFPTPLFEQRFVIPTWRDVDRLLVLGAALFGFGWGLIGLCPGPAITAVVTGNASVFIFLLAMAAGMYGYDWFISRRSAAPYNSDNSDSSIILPGKS